MFVVFVSTFLFFFIAVCFFGMVYAQVIFMASRSTLAMGTQAFPTSSI